MGEVPEGWRDVCPPAYKMIADVANKAYQHTQGQRVALKSKSIKLCSISLLQGGSAHHATTATSIVVLTKLQGKITDCLCAGLHRHRLIICEPVILQAKPKLLRHRQSSLVRLGGNEPCGETSVVGLSKKVQFPYLHELRC